MKLYYYLALIHGWFYLLTGVWPLVHYSSFEAVTGPKTDVWLVKTVGVLVLVIGFVILTARKDFNVPVIILALACAAGLTVIDTVYVLKGTIDRIYLMDAFAEVVLIIGWISVLISVRRNERQSL